MAKRARKDEVQNEVLPEYSCPPFEKGKVYRNRNFGLFKVISIDTKHIEYDMLEGNKCTIKESNDDIFENICRNTYYEDWKRLNGVKQRLTELDD